MSRKNWLGDAAIEVGEQPEAAPVPESDTPFRILLLGDFSGRASRGAYDPKLGGRRPLRVDRDSFELLLERLAVELRLPVGAAGDAELTLRFEELDDFHPDRLAERVELFQALRERRDRLADRATFAAAAAELGALAPRRTPPEPVPERPPLAGGSVFEQILEQAEHRPARVVDDWDLLLREIVAPYVEPRPDPQQPELIAQVDAAISGQMRALLHAPAFQSLEALWRGLFFLVRQLETSGDLQLYVLDVTLAELAGDLGATDDVRATALYRLIVEPSVGTRGGQPWAVLAGAYTFDNSAGSVALLGRAAKLAKAAGAPFLAGASSRILGCASLAETPDPRKWRPAEDAGTRGWWEALRRLPDAHWLGLALPRFLLRLPYGKQTSAIESFAFEEMPGTPPHEAYLWGNPAFACLYLLAQAFSEYGWDFRPGAVRDLDGLPAHVYREDGESQLKPCAEVLLTEAAVEAVLERGLMPLISIKGSDRVQLGRFQSIAEPPAPLAGRWA